MEQTPRPLIVVVGPTAVGKTDVAIQLGEALNGEIISADSRQIYRGMDIGTAKPTAEQQARVRHHLLDIVNPDENFTLAEYQAAALTAIDEVFGRGKQPLLVGGTGLYVRAVVEGLRIPRVPPNPTRRAELQRQPMAELYARLQVLDPPAAERILPGNSRRIIRALEVIEATGKRISELQTRQRPPYPIIQIGLTLPRAELYARVDTRIDRMLAAGLVEEIKGLLGRGYAPDLPAMTSLGYRELGRYLSGELSLEAAVQLFKNNTRKFIRHQYNWFRLTDPRVRWFDLSVQTIQDAQEYVVRELGGANS